MSDAINLLALIILSVWLICVSYRACENLKLKNEILKKRLDRMKDDE